MPAQRPRATFEPISPHFDLPAFVEATPNFHYVDRISCDMIEQQGMAAFERLVTLHVIIGGKPLVIDGFEARLDPWTFSPKWLRDNMGEKVEHVRDIGKQENVPMSMGHYLRNMALLANQFFEGPGSYGEKKRQRMYLKDIDCPAVWHDKLKQQLPAPLCYLNDSTGEIGGLGAMPDAKNGNRPGRGIARAGDLMSSLPPDMRAENEMCYIGHEGTYTPAHREMCASLGHNIMVEASGTVSDDGKAEKPGSSIWFMTESKDRHTVSEYWLSVLGHDIEVEGHFAQMVAWKKAPFNVYVVEQTPGDFILIPPLAPHQVWNRGTRTMKAAWNRTSVETLELALAEALPRSRIVCRDEQYKNKAIVYYTLQKYSSLLTLAQQQAGRLRPDEGERLLYTGKVKQLLRDFKRLFDLYKTILLSEMFHPDDRDGSKTAEYLPFDGNVTCAYCRGNIFNRFLSCPTCKDVLGHSDDDPYDVCMDCYAMGRSCACLSGLKWAEQFRWKELAHKYDAWRKLILAFDRGLTSDKTPLALLDERRRLAHKTLAEVCKEQLKRRPWKDVHNPAPSPPSDSGADNDEIHVDDAGTVKKMVPKRSKSWLRSHATCHLCKKPHPNWRMAACTTCERWWCYGALWRGWDAMPLTIMQDRAWTCPHCLGICFAGSCRRDVARQKPYEPRGTLLGYDTRRVADARSVEALVDFGVSNLTWLRDGDAVARTTNTRIKRAALEAQREKDSDPRLDAELEGEEPALDDTGVAFEYSPEHGALDPALDTLGDDTAALDPALLDDDDDDDNDDNDDDDDDAGIRHALQDHRASLPGPGQMLRGAAPAGYTPVQTAGYVPPVAAMYPQPESASPYPGHNAAEELVPRPASKKRPHGPDDAEDNIAMHRPKPKHPRLPPSAADPARKSEAGRQFEREKERRALELARARGRLIAFQAARKGKSRVVVLRLARPAAAGAALAPVVDEDVLRSDLAPPQDPKARARDLYQARARDGRLITSHTTRARIPVARDADYAYKPRDPRGRAAGAQRARVEFEEVDVTDEEGEGEEAAGAATVAPAAPRRVSSYLRLKHARDEAGLLEELPGGWRDSPAHGGAAAGRGKTTRGRGAGARRVEAGDDDEEDHGSAHDAEATGPPPPPALADAAPDADAIESQAIDAVARAAFAQLTQRSSSSIAAQPPSPPKKKQQRGRGRPPKPRPAAATASMAEQNRRAKLQVMRAQDGGVVSSSPDAEREDGGEDSSVEGVPSKAALAAGVLGGDFLGGEVRLGALRGGG